MNRGDVTEQHKTQRPYLICPRCSRRMKVMRITDYEFSAKCKCGEDRVISWAHKNPPPRLKMKCEGNKHVFLNNARVCECGKMTRKYMK